MQAAMHGEEGECGVFSDCVVGEHSVLRIEIFGSARGVEEVDDQDGSVSPDPFSGTGGEEGAISVVEDSQALSL